MAGAYRVPSGLKSFYVVEDRSGPAAGIVQCAQTRTEIVDRVRTYVREGGVDCRSWRPLPRRRTGDKFGSKRGPNTSWQLKGSNISNCAFFFAPSRLCVRHAFHCSKGIRRETRSGGRVEVAPMGTGGLFA